MVRGLDETRPGRGVGLERLVPGIVFIRFEVDGLAMFWPAAALAVFFLGFAFVYGSVVESRFKGSQDPKD